jgi:hypothetical protein
MTEGSHVVAEVQRADDLALMCSRCDDQLKPLQRGSKILVLNQGSRGNETDSS